MISSKTVRIVYTNPENQICIVVPAPEMFDPDSSVRKLLRDKGIDFQSEIDIIEWIRSHDVPANCQSFITDVSEIPSDRKFRKAWALSLTGSAVVVDLEKAKNIKKDDFRELRKSKLEALDIDYLRALEQDDAVAMNSIREKKQQLRDVTLVPLPDNLEELRDFIPDILKG